MATNETSSHAITKETSAKALMAGATLAEPKSLSAILHESILEDDRVREVVAERLAKRAREFKPFVNEYKHKFRDFRPSKLTPEREQGSFGRDRKDMRATLEAVARKGAESLRTGSDYRALTLHAEGDNKDLISKAIAGGNVVGTIAMPVLLDFLLPKLAAPPTLRNDPAVTACKANDAAEAALLEIEGKSQQPRTSNPQTPTLETDLEPEKTKDFVSRHVHTVMHTATSPEEALKVNVERRATQDDAALGAVKFQLRDGASDATSYHDFNSLQIAFEHVWEETRADVKRFLHDVAVDKTSANLKTKARGRARVRGGPTPELDGADPAARAADRAPAQVPCGGCVRVAHTDHRTGHCWRESAGETGQSAWKCGEWSTRKRPT